MHPTVQYTHSHNIFKLTVIHFFTRHCHLQKLQQISDAHTKRSKTNIPRHKVPGTKRPKDKTSQGQNIPGTKRPKEQNVPRDNTSQGQNLPETKRPKGQNMCGQLPNLIWPG